MNKRIRALSAEQAIEAMNLNFECGNGDCTFSGLKKDLEEHEETCEYDYEDVDDSDEDSDDELYQPPRRRRGRWRRRPNRRYLEPNQPLDSVFLTLAGLTLNRALGEAWH